MKKSASKIFYVLLALNKRGDFHIHIVKQNVILTFLVDGWFLRKPA